MARFPTHLLQWGSTNFYLLRDHCILREPLGVGLDGRDGCGMVNTRRAAAANAPEVFMAVEHRTLEDHFSLQAAFNVTVLESRTVCWSGHPTTQAMQRYVSFSVSVSSTAPGNASYALAPSSLRICFITCLAHSKKLAQLNGLFLRSLTPKIRNDSGGKFRASKAKAQNSCPNNETSSIHPFVCRNMT